MPSSTAALNPPSFAEFIDALTAHAMLAFIEQGRASLAPTSVHAVEQGFRFMGRMYTSPTPKDASVVHRLEQELQVALLDGLLRSGTAGVRQALQSNYEMQHQAADKRPSACAPAAASETANERSYDSIVLVVCAVVADHLNIDLSSVSPESKLVEDLGSDSLDIVDFTMLLDTALGIDIDGEDIAGLRTVKDLVDLACKHLALAPRAD